MEAINKPTNSNESTVRITIDLPESLYISMKTKVAAKRTTIKSFFLELLKENFEK